MTVLGLITARGGSKGIPRKALRALGGKPVIAWTIEAALASTALDRVIVSTDDAEIAEVARRFGAATPFLRPAELARDDTPHILAALHALDWLRDHEGYEPDYLFLLQPTSPFRTSGDIDAAAALARQRNADAVVGVTEAESHPYLTKRLLPDGTLGDFVTPDIPYTRRQDLPVAYHINGAVYVNRCTSLRTSRTFVPTGTLPYVMPSERSLDLDTPWDLELAESILQRSHRDA